MGRHRTRESNDQEPTPASLKIRGNIWALGGLVGTVTTTVIGTEFVVPALEGSDYVEAAIGGGVGILTLTGAVSATCIGLKYYRQLGHREQKASSEFAAAAELNLPEGHESPEQLELPPSFASPPPLLSPDTDR